MSRALRLQSGLLRRWNDASEWEKHVPENRANCADCDRQHRLHVGTRNLALASNGAGISPALSLYSLNMGPRYGSFDSTSVPAAESIPPIPFTSEIFALGTWRAPHSPRCWRVASIMGKMPYMPEWV